MRWIKQQAWGRLSGLSQGVIGSIATILFFGACLYPTMAALAAAPSPGLLRSIATVGVGLWIGWAIQSAFALGTSPVRGHSQEVFVGTIMGTTACGFGGIITALVLAERAAAGDWLWLDRVAFALAASALTFVGICVVFLVYFIYDWNRLERIDPPE